MQVPNFLKTMKSVLIAHTPSIFYIKQKGKVDSKMTGIVRNIDSLGHIVIPCEILRALNMKSGDYFEFFEDDDKIVLQKLQEKCVFCGTSKNLLVFRKKMFCRKCLENIKNRFS